MINSFYARLYHANRDNIDKSNELSSVTSAEQINNYLSKGVDAIRLTSYTLDNMIRIGRPRTELLDFLVDQSAAMVNTTEGNTTGVYGYIGGEYMDGTGWEPDDSYVPTERPWYVAARSNVGRVAVVDPYLDAETGTVLITFSKTLCDARSVAAMDFSLDSLQDITEQIAAEDGLDMEIVLDNKYQVIAHSDRGERGKNYLTEDGTFGAELVRALRDTDESSFSLKYGGEEYIVYAFSVSNEWLCLSVFNATETFRAMRSSVVYTIIITVAAVLVLLVIFDRSARRQEQTSRLRYVVEALAAAIDAKDAYTNGHSGRVAEYAREIGALAGYRKKKQEELYLMGLLHDVGKIGIPDAVINKPGGLTEEEFDMIRTHPTIGSDMLSKTTEMPRMAVGARWHHERYDGTGYPDGLAGTDIPEEARIIAVADAYDAMTSRRSYRDALPQDVVRSEIENGKGTQFDPTFADIMLQMIRADKEYRMHGQ